MQPDKTIILGNSEIQYGPYNDRIYLMHLDPKDSKYIVDYVLDLADKKELSKIITKVPHRCMKDFLEKGFIIEATIPKFINENEHLHFMSKFLKKDRLFLNNKDILKKIRETAEKSLKFLPDQLPKNYILREAAFNDSCEIAMVYQAVFDSYPFPIMDPHFIESNLSSNVRYFIIKEFDTIIAVASAEMNPDTNSVEMTDFATLPEYRGRKLGSHLLWEMENRMVNEGYKVAYTICRADAYGINITFARRGYKFGGLLVNNTNISGDISSMNIWHKHLLEQQF